MDGEGRIDWKDDKQGRRKDDKLGLMKEIRAVIKRSCEGGWRKFCHTHSLPSILCSTPHTPPPPPPPLPPLPLLPLFMIFHATES